MNQSPPDAESGDARFLLSEQEQEKLAQLARVKRLATGVLILCFLVMIGAKLLAARYPALEFVAAFAEAATIGGIADWYAVVALFKRPLGLPIPHTAIIPSNRDRIADNLGRFIEKNFLSQETVSAKLREIAFADEIAAWLSDKRKANDLARFVSRLVPQLLETVERSEMGAFAAARLKEQFDRTQVAPMAATLLDAFVKDGRHNELLDELIGGLRVFLADEQALESIRDKVKDELPSLLYIFQAEGTVVRRIVKAASGLLDEVKADKDHPLRAEFEDFLTGYVEQIKTSRRFARRVEALKHDLLERPEVGEVAQRIWLHLRDWLQDDVKRDDSRTVERLADMFGDIGHELAAAPRLKRDIDREMVRVLSALVERQKSSVSGFIADQVKGWDFAQLTVLIEANIGRDLQYIRFNGMLIGGIAGLVLHTVIVLLQRI